MANGLDRIKQRADEPEEVTEEVMDEEVIAPEGEMDETVAEETEEIPAPDAPEIPAIGKVNAAIDAFKDALVEGQDEAVIIQDLIAALQSALEEVQGAEAEDIVEDEGLTVEDEVLPEDEAPINVPPLNAVL